MREMIVKVNGFQREGHEPVLQYAGELIRCKDCKHWRSNGDFPRGEYCTRFQGSGYVWHSRPEDFCSLAEPTLSRWETALSEENQRGTIK